MNDNDYQLKRPLNHENVSEDLIIYALPHWECPSETSSEDRFDGESGDLAWTMFALLGILGLCGALTVF